MMAHQQHKDSKVMNHSLQQLYYSYLPLHIYNLFNFFKKQSVIDKETSKDFWIQLPPVILVSSDDELVLFSFP